MKLCPNISSAHRTAGIFLIECLVYLSVFTLLLGGGMTVFYFCWNHSAALIYETEDIHSALNAGERWRADVRAATGKISIEKTAAGEVAHIPEDKKEILYRFESGEMRRQVASSDFSELLLPKVKTSQMETEKRGEVTAWRWELELTQRRKEMHLPLLFTFEAVQSKP